MRMNLIARHALTLVTAVMALTASARAAEKSLARYIAKDDLIVYSEFAGLDAHASAWRKTATYRLLNETTAGTMLEDVMAQVVDGALAAAPEANRPTGKQVVTSIERFVRSGFVLGINGKIGAAPPQSVIVIRDAGGKDVGTWVRQLLDLATKFGGKSESVTREDGRKVTFIKPSDAVNGAPGWAWWFEGNDLVVSLPGNEATVEAIVETIAGKRPSATDSPLHADLAKTTDGFEPVFVSFADLTNLPPLPPSLGLSGLKRLDSRWGFQGPALMSVTRIVAPAPRTGLLALFDQPTFKVTSTLPVPEGLTDYSIVSIDVGKLFDQIVAIAKQTDPNTEAIVKQFRGMAQGVLGVEVRDELLAQVGPKMAFYVEPEATMVPITPYHGIAEWMLHPPKFTVLVEVKDAEKFAKTLDTLMEVANRQIKARMANAPNGGVIEFRKIKDGGRGYVLHIPLGTAPIPAGVLPAFVLGKSYLAFAISPREARKALAFEGRPATKVAGPLAGLPGDLIVLNVNDPTTYVPDVIANIPFFVQAMAMMGANGPGGPGPLGVIRLDLDQDKLPTAESLKPFMFPGTMTVAVNDGGIEVVSRDAVPSMNPLAAGPVAAALLLPAVQAARTAARRAQSTNNLKQIMLAMHNYHSSNNHFPAAATADAEGKPLLSWRVAILPFLEQQELYDQFHLNEPWDSAHNKTLIAKMPDVYKSTMNQPKDPFSTFYQVFTGNGALFDPMTKGPSIADVTDGTSYTIAAVEAGTAVVWTKPEDIPFDPSKDLPKLGGPGFPGGFNAAFGDGSVRFITTFIRPNTWVALSTRDGGEVVNADD